MYLGITVAAHGLGRRTRLDNLRGDPGQVSWDLGGGGVAPQLEPLLPMKFHGLLTSIICPCIVHYRDTSMEVSQVVAGWLRAKRGAPQFRSLLSCMGIRMDFAKWRPTV